MHALHQMPLESKYLQAEDEQLHERIVAAKKSLGDQLVILGHHYQRDQIIRYADFRGDSLKLAQVASQQTRAKYIVFCGVHFMAESADLLTGEDVAVLLPHLAAGCPMADMAQDIDLDRAMDELARLTDDAAIVPVTYVNSSAAVKAVTGRRGGSCCTSSNCQAVLEWALRGKDEGGAGGRKILAAPDQHLARATALDIGYSLDDCALYDPALPDGGLTAEQATAARFLLWKGFCRVHQLFSVSQIERRRQQFDDIQVIVHPECPIDVVAAADMHGSTGQIIQTIADAPSGSTWAVGTEVNLVARLAEQHPDKTIVSLSEGQTLCTTMFRIDLPHLCWVLENLVEGRLVNQVKVPAAIREDARKSVERMVRLTGQAKARP